MAASSLSGVQKGVTFLFPAEGGHSLSHVPQMLVLYISEGEGAMPFISRAGAGEQEGRQHTYAAVSCQIASG